MAPDGVLVVQVTDFPWNLQRTTQNLRCVFPHVIPIDIGFQFSMFNFVLASAQPFQQHRRLPPNLRFMTQRRISAILSITKQFHCIVWNNHLTADEERKLCTFH
jgi:hypothetical protein